ncbi:MAG: enoyl-CoA hydratase [Dinoroseobacter sp.]|jgi:enoyl-CoA hydratase
MTDIHIRRDGFAGRITLNRPEALNALTYQMILDIHAALKAWADDDAIKLLILDASGDRAFCAGGDIVEMYETGSKGDYAYGRQFWRDEYRMNAAMFTFPKPVISLLQGFTMGGGVGVGCHASHRIVCETSKIAMPEVSIGLIPDVGGTLLLARAPGRLGEYLGTMATRMDAGDAIHVGFADYFVRQADWPSLVTQLCENGDPDAVDRAAQTAPDSMLAAHQDEIDDLFGGETLGDILRLLDRADTPFTQTALKTLNRNAPLPMASAIELIHRARTRDDIFAALGQEFRYVWRAAEQGDFVEGIRAAIIDKDRKPVWKHATPAAVKPHEVSAMLRPLGADALIFEMEV